MNKDVKYLTPKRSVKEIHGTEPVSYTHLTLPTT